MIKIPFEIIETRLITGANKSPEFKKINPLGKGEKYLMINIAISACYS